MYKLKNKQDLVNWYKAPESVSINNTRDNRYKLRREIVRNCAPRYNFFTNRVVNSWNQLSNESIESRSIIAFKANIDKLLKD